MQVNLITYLNWLNLKKSSNLPIETCKDLHNSTKKEENRTQFTSVKNVKRRYSRRAVADYHLAVWNAV